MNDLMGFLALTMTGGFLLHIPLDSGHPFRSIPATDSA
jgi:hypothetical protein